MSTKIQDNLQNTYEKKRACWSKICDFSMKKLVAAAFTANIEKITVVGPPFSGKTRFLQIWGSLGGPKHRENWPRISTTKKS